MARAGKRGIMSYTLENTDELFIVEQVYGLHIVMSKKEIQELLKDDYKRKNIRRISKLKFEEEKPVTLKYFLPKNWQKINQRTTAYRIYKEISESEE